MKADDFISCPDHLVSSAIAYGEWLENRGYRVRIEPFDLAFPNTPYFVAKRHRTTLIVEVMDKPDWKRLEEWAKYARACNTETRVQLCLVKDRSIDVTETGKFSGSGIGVAVWDGNLPMEVISPQDLALNVSPPALPPALRSKLGHAYDQFDRGEWREGFEEACLVLEQEARSYFLKHVGKRIDVLGPNGTVKNPTPTAIRRMTLGQLAEAFGRIRSPNQTDSRVGEALGRVNGDRVSVVHFKNVSARREAMLRKRFGKNLMVVVNALKLIRGIR